MLLIDDAQRGPADIAAGRTYAADATIARLQQRRSGGTKSCARRSATATTRKPTRKRR